MSARQRFLPWLRSGLAAGAAGGAVRATVPVTVRVDHGDGVVAVPFTLRLPGPGDVVGLDQRQVIRTDPQLHTVDFETSRFVTLEFDEPALPWLFSPDPTPAPGDALGRIRPWLCLVVVRRDRAELAAGEPLPVMTVTVAAEELPDLGDSWAWAHAQIADVGEPLDRVLAERPELTLSRLVCPRRLAAGTSYLACLVPAFEAGRRAGLGEPPDGASAPAWTTPPPATVRLPVLHSWEFATGAAGSFADLVGRLVPRVLPEDIGRRLLDVSDAGAGLPTLPGTVLALECALRAPGSKDSGWPAGARERLEPALLAQLEAAPGTAAAVVTPPVYGELQRPRGPANRIPGPSDSPAWLRQLNLDPRHRVAAALGARVVQHDQEELVASAWDQLGEIERANRLLRHAQLARAASGPAYQRLAALPAETALRVTEPAHARVRIGTAGEGPAPAIPTLQGSVDRSALPRAVVSGPFRRAFRPLGPLGRRLTDAPAEDPAAGLVQKLANDAVRVAIQEPLAGAVPFDTVGAPRLATLTTQIPSKDAAKGWRKIDGAAGDDPQAHPFKPRDRFQLRRAAAPGVDSEPVARSLVAGQERLAAMMPARPKDDYEPPGTGETYLEEQAERWMRLAGINKRFRDAAGELQAHLAAPPRRAAAPRPSLELGRVADALLRPGGQLDPETAVAREALPLVPPAPGGQADPLTPRRIEISFPQPIGEGLARLAPEFVLGDADGMPADSIGVVEANPRFIESFLAGANHELSRELRWRGVPVPLGATFFRRFWDVRATGPGGAVPLDIPPIAGWNGPLGEHAVRVGGTGMLVLVVRGELLRRHPSAVIYAVRAAAPERLGTEERYPELRGRLEPDLTYVGFGLTLAEARGAGADPGWFFVIQEQPTAPRFGPAAGAPGANAADTALATLQRPLRVAVHARDLLGEQPDTGSRITHVAHDGNRIAAIGGEIAAGRRWRQSAEEAIEAIAYGRRSYFVEEPVGDRVAVVVAYRDGRAYLKTVSDGDRPNNLLALPGLSW
jgi:hypothetical protein